jgi:hypothetical protein
MLDKNHLIDLILKFNPSSSRDWLDQFRAEQLRSYLDHLEFTMEPRGRNSRWARPGDTPAVVWRKAG